jgi:membrane-associated phospholipid phosphatase
MSVEDRDRRPHVADTRWWPVDKVILAYLAFTTLLILIWWGAVPDAGWLMFWHVAGVLVLWVEVKRPNPFTWVFRHWYPLPYVAACYKEMSLLIPPIRGGGVDRQLAAIDYRIWGAHPTVWLERIQGPLLTEILQVLYSLFVPVVMLVAFWIWKRRWYPEFRQYAFLIALGFLVSYVGYLLVPARGPRFLLAGLQHTELRGLWLYQFLRVGLDRLESAHYDCFPSGHTELTALAWWGSRQISRRLGYTYFAYTGSIIFATVYLRYHYTIDVLAGALVAVILMFAAPLLYQTLDQGTSIWPIWKSSGFRTGRR